MDGNDNGNQYVTVGNAAKVTGKVSATNKAATATAASAAGNAEDAPYGNDYGNAAMVAYSARQQLEVIRDTLLAPLIAQNDRLVAQVTEQAEAIGRLQAEREAFESERNEIRSQLDALQATETADTAHDEPQVLGRSIAFLRQGGGLGGRYGDGVEQGS